jgi:hypothetical protein
MGALSAARERGLAVPREITVIGFDDIPMASWPLINLTTVRCDLDALAAAAADLLLQEMNPTRAATSRTHNPRITRAAQHSQHSITHRLKVIDHSTIALRARSARAGPQRSIRSGRPIVASNASAAPAGAPSLGARPARVRQVDRGGMRHSDLRRI